MLKVRSERRYSPSIIPNNPGYQLAVNLKDGRTVPAIVERYDGNHKLMIDATAIDNNWARVQFDQVESWQAVDQDPARMVRMMAGVHEVSVCKMHIPLVEKLSRGASDIIEDWNTEATCEICPSKFPCYVSVYLENRAYGGPEEGGWWYDYGTLQADPRNRCFTSMILAKRYAGKLQAELDANENAERRSDTSSMASEGCFRAWIDSDGEFPKNYPDKKPTYE